MFGFMFGLACLGGLYMYLSREHDRHPRQRRRGWGRGHRLQQHILRRLYNELETTPSQEEIIEQAVRELRHGGSSLRREFAGGRSELANALRGDRFDSSALDGWSSRQDAAMGQLRKTTLEALARVHEVLDSWQRQRLADMLNEGVFRRRRCRFGGSPC